MHHLPTRVRGSRNWYLAPSHQSKKSRSGDRPGLCLPCHGHWCQMSLRQTSPLRTPASPHTPAKPLRTCCPLLFQLRWGESSPKEVKLLWFHMWEILDFSLYTITFFLFPKAPTHLRIKFLFCHLQVMIWFSIFPNTEVFAIKGGAETSNPWISWAEMLPFLSLFQTLIDSSYGTFCPCVSLKITWAWHLFSCNTNSIWRRGEQPD